MAQQQKPSSALSSSVYTQNFDLEKLHLLLLAKAAKIAGRLVQICAFPSAHHTWDPTKLEVGIGRLPGLSC